MSDKNENNKKKRKNKIKGDRYKTTSMIYYQQ